MTPIDDFPPGQPGWAFPGREGHSLILTRGLSGAIRWRLRPHAEPNSHFDQGVISEGDFSLALCHMAGTDYRDWTEPVPPMPEPIVARIGETVQDILDRIAAALSRPEDETVDITDSPVPDPEPINYFPGQVTHKSRPNVREAIDPRVYVHLYGDPGQPAHLAMTIPQALALVEALMKVIGEMVRRWDIHVALHRTAPGSV